MKAEKIRNLTDVELKHQERDLADQLFKLKFQMNMGQTESLKKIRGLRRDIARVQTVIGERARGARRQRRRSNGGNHAEDARPPQGTDRHRRLEQDAEDDRRRSDA